MGRHRDRTRHQSLLLRTPIALAAADQRTNQRAATTLAVQRHRPQHRSRPPRRHRRQPQPHAPQTPQLETRPHHLHSTQLQPPLEFAVHTKVCKSRTFWYASALRSTTHQLERSERYMKRVKVLLVIVLIASLFSPIANAGATDSSGKANGVLLKVNPYHRANDGNTDGADVSQSRFFWLFFWQPSPSGCQGVPTHAHPSKYFPGQIGYRVTVTCDLYVSEIEIEVWGDRSSWSGWRQHTDGHARDSVTNQAEFRMSQHKTGLSGTYNYRTRGKAWSVENGNTYYANLSGASKRITCSSSGTSCAWAT